jgi:hypothetical protein
MSGTEQAYKDGIRDGTAGSPMDPVYVNASDKPPTGPAKKVYMDAYAKGRRQHAISTGLVTGKSNMSLPTTAGRRKTKKSKTVKRKSIRKTRARK